MLNRTILAAFLATSAIALGIDPAVANRVEEQSVECLQQGTCGSPDTVRGCRPVPDVTE